MIHRMVATSTPLHGAACGGPLEYRSTPFGASENVADRAVWRRGPPGTDSDGTLPNTWRRAADVELRRRPKGAHHEHGDKIKHAGEEAVGKVKEATGKVTGNESLEAEGQADQAKADVKQAGDKAGDAAKDVFGN